MNSIEKLLSAYEQKRHICVGLDTDIELIPKHLLEFDDPVYEFNKEIINATINSAGAYKFNLAFYESNGIKGITSLLKSLEFIDGRAFTIGDGKRGDIGNTSSMYAKSMFDYFNFDSTTVNPLMGFDSVNPFLEYSSKITYVLGLTSNSGAQDFEKLILVGGKKLFQKIIEKLTEWNKNKNLGIVFGATQLNELIENFEQIKNTHLLIPGVGSQGGSLEEIAEFFSKNNFNSFLINASRSIIYKDKSISFAAGALEELNNLNLTLDKN
ncbi:MAG: orotidine-5'-phosphate decarboxylase [Chlorobiaceae bacterium]|nr:orotidine-5'-phosphate decarboxylase [Chlorobiaceae bacterium]MBA4309717.1 orotidine-5'-phosphate decarboxylase [Chlorobiaceae bacterium]